MDASKIFLLFIFCNFDFISAENSLSYDLEEKFQYKLSEYTNYVAKWLEDFNDRHIGNSEIGRKLRYDILKPKFGITAGDSSLAEAKGMKKMSMALIPLIFHIGATSTWMLLTSIMTVKSVAIGMALLIFKIAVSSAKVASFFTSLKAKHSHHESWAPHSWAPHYEHHGHERSFSDIASYLPSDWSSYTPEVHLSSPSHYKTIPSFKTEEHFEEAEFPAESKKVPVIRSRR